MRMDMRVLGVLLGAVLLGFVLWWSLSDSVAVAQPPSTPGGSGDRASSLAGTRRPAQPAWSAPAASANLDSRELELRMLVAKVRASLGRSYERASSQGDFALAPGRILKGLLERRCGLVRRHAEELSAHREQLGLTGPDAEGFCRDLLFSLLQERHSLPEGTSQARFWESLARVDEAAARHVLAEPSASRGETFLAAYERFRQERRDLVGPGVERKLFGLSDELVRLPFQVDELVNDPRPSPEQRMATYENVLQRIGQEYGVELASVVEPLELAKNALRLHETAGALGLAQQQAILEKYAGSETTRLYLEHQLEQQDRGERLRAFNQERDRLLEQLTRAGLTPEQLRERMPEIDQQLFEKYNLQ
ncbi:lipase secretion chaperone [Archangium lansingense]|uniref:Lipase helper protein n=1 Tax=Archangium lansingense TaxID=2995310 RepID=A0ABT4AEZ5_9BACT|nr:lipase secretion chaperone [Archangium lansinium]MCY1080253.1 lipase secretion chaperone [Archangium lansinium]